jgi:Flp pilus assembly protein protease CpaA
MQGDYSTFLLGALAVMLLIAAIGDLRTREISNWLNAAIALLAIPFWFSIGLDPWPAMAIQLAAGAGVFLLFAILFQFGVMGGGDAAIQSATIASRSSSSGAKLSLCPCRISPCDPPCPRQSKLDTFQPRSCQ